MEDDLGPSSPEDGTDGCGITDVAQDHLLGVEQRTTVDRQLDRMEGGLVAVQHHQLGRTVPVDLAAQLRADRAARAGDQDPAPGQVAGDGADVGVELVAAEDVGEVDVTQVADPDVVGQQLAAGGEHLDRRPRSLRLPPQPRHQLGGRAGDRDDHDLGTGRGHELARRGPWCRRPGPAPAAGGASSGRRRPGRPEARCAARRAAWRRPALSALPRADDQDGHRGSAPGVAGWGSAPGTRQCGPRWASTSVRSPAPAGTLRGIHWRARLA